MLFFKLGPKQKGKESGLALCLVRIHYTIFNTSHLTISFTLPVCCFFFPELCSICFLNLFHILFALLLPLFICMYVCISIHSVKCAIILLYKNYYVFLGLLLLAFAWWRSFGRQFVVYDMFWLYFIYGITLNHFKFKYEKPPIEGWKEKHFLSIILEYFK